MIKEGVVKIGHTPCLETGAPCRVLDLEDEAHDSPLAQLLHNKMTMVKLGNLFAERRADKLLKEQE